MARAIGATLTGGANVADMEVDGAAPQKVSTSGPRLARREAYRTDKGFQVSRVALFTCETRL